MTLCPKIIAGSNLHDSFCDETAMFLLNFEVRFAKQSFFSPHFVLSHFLAIFIGH